MKIRDDGPRIDAMLRHLGCGRDLRDFPATANERVALIRTAGARGLVAWRRTRARYELTTFGWDELMPNRRFGISSLLISAATGGVAGVIAAAVFWLPPDGAPPRGHSSAALSRLEKPNLLQTARSAEISVPRYAASPAMPVIEDAVARAPESETNEPPRLDRPDLTDRPAVDQPKAESGASGVREAGTRKSRKTAHHRRRDQGRSWAYAGPWRSRSIRYAGYYGQRGWFGYR
jgi:hypothetical protein